MLLDHRRAILLPHRLGLDQALVRPGNRLQDLHPSTQRCPTDPREIHGP